MRIAGSCPWHRTIAAALLATLSCGAGVFAGETFSDPKGRFAIDLPSGWALQAQTDESVYIFKGSSDTIILQYYVGALSRGELFQNGINTLRGSMPTAEAKGDVVDMEINGTQARWGIYRDTLLVGRTKVALYGMLGSVSLKQGGLYFLAIVNEQSLRDKQELIEGSFRSIRDVGGTVIRAVAESKAVPAVEVSRPALKEPLRFKKRDVSIVLPPGWVEIDKAGQYEEEFLGWFESQTVPGTVLFVYAYTGVTAGYTNVRIRGLKTIAQAYPKGQEELKEARTIRTDNGRTAKLEVWRGFLQSGDTVVVKQTPMAILKTEEGGWLMMLGFVPEASAPWFEDEFIKILQTIE